MEILGKNNQSTLENIRLKHAEKDFFENIAEHLDGVAISKLTPFTRTYFDLLYINNGRVMLIKFIDTNQDTYDILGEEILEILEEEDKRSRKIFDKHFPDESISKLFIMPYAKADSKKITLVDKEGFEKLKAKPEALLDYFGEESHDLERLRYHLSPELYLLKRIKKNTVFEELIISQEDKHMKATLLEREQIELINTIKYGKTLIKGLSGSGKTTLMFARAVKMARLYPKDKFLYVVFDKQLAYNLKENIILREMRLSNLKIVSYHQYVLLLGKKFGLRINVEQKSNFDKEFEKILKKVNQIYKHDHTFKGIFLDEGENYRSEDIEFLQGNLYKRKWVFQMAVDLGKDIKNREKISESQVEALNFDEIIELKKNYRQPKAQLQYLSNLKEQMKAYANIDITRGVFSRQSTGESEKKGNLNFKYSTDTVGMMKDICQEIKNLLSEGYSYSDIAVVYPFNKRNIKRKGQIYSQYIAKNGLTKAELPYIFASGQLDGLREKVGITLSNIYNICNLEYKIIILCEIDALIENLPKPLEIKATDEYLMLYNIIYTAVSRSEERTYIYLREDVKSHGLQEALIDGKK